MEKFILSSPYKALLLLGATLLVSCSGVQLEEINGIDGSEVKRDWGAPLQKAVVKRVAEEVVKIRERRARITDGDDFQI